MTVSSLPARSDFDVIFKSPDAKCSTRDFLILGAGFVGSRFEL